MDHRTRLAALPALEEGAHGGARLYRTEPVQVQLGIGSRVEQRIARVEGGVASFASRAHDRT